MSKVITGQPRPDRPNLAARKARAKVQPATAAVKRHDDGVQVFTMTIPGNWWMSANSRMHRMEQARRTDLVRQSTGLFARSKGLRKVAGPVRVEAAISYLPSVVTADPPNAGPTVKAMLDGLTDAGIWPDDNSRHVVSVAYSRGHVPVQGDQHAVDLIITPARADT